jgi:hypothetical protein
VPGRSQNEHGGSVTLPNSETRRTRMRKNASA